MVKAYRSAMFAGVVLEIMATHGHAFAQSINQTQIRGTITYLQQFYLRIQRRRGGDKANIALARKFLGVIYHTVKNKWAFSDFPNFVLAS